MTEFFLHNLRIKLILILLLSQELTFILTSIIMHIQENLNAQEENISNNEVQKLNKQDDKHTTVRCVEHGLFSDAAVLSLPAIFRNLCAL
jgi:hypothetical protein